MDKSFLLIYLNENDKQIIKDWINLNPELKTPEKVLLYVLRSHSPKPVSDLSSDIFDEEEIEPGIAPENVENLLDSVERIDPFPAPEAKLGVKVTAGKLGLRGLFSGIRSGRK